MERSPYRWPVATASIVGSVAGFGLGLWEANAVFHMSRAQHAGQEITILQSRIEAASQARIALRSTPVATRLTADTILSAQIRREQYTEASVARAAPRFGLPERVTAVSMGVGEILLLSGLAAILAYRATGIGSHPRQPVEPSQHDLGG
jgi:hypothetical protein